MARSGDDSPETYPRTYTLLGTPSYGAWDDYYDGPGLGLLALSSISINQSFKTYWRFRPARGTGAMYDSIYITLGLVNWNWFGNAEESG